MTRTQSQSEIQHGWGSPTFSVIAKLDALANPEKTMVLAKIWDDVVHRIIDSMLAISEPEIEILHINLREEMILELAKLRIHISEQVVTKRMGERRASEIDVEAERQECLGAEGLKAIENTARIYAEHVWLKLYKERWEPKTKKALEREANPKQTTLALKPVEKNHYISKWLIRDHWSQNGQIRRFQRDGPGKWTDSFTGLGNWGYASDLYSDRLEAYFALIEGDAKIPVSKLLNAIPLNRPECEALVGFFIIHLIRNPEFINRLKGGISPLVTQSVGRDKADDPEYMRQVYETLFGNNEFYNRFASPVFWNAWVLIRAEEPAFVLPDVYCCTCRIDEETHLLVPLTPHVCFATLARREETKRIIPHSHEAPPELAHEISLHLRDNARDEFLAHENFESPKPASVASCSLATLLRDLEAALPKRNGMEDGYYPSGSSSR